MKKSRFTDEQIVAALRDADASSVPVFAETSNAEKAASETVGMSTKSSSPSAGKSIIFGVPSIRTKM